MIHLIKVRSSTSSGTAFNLQCSGKSFKRNFFQSILELLHWQSRAWLLVQKWMQQIPVMQEPRSRNGLATVDGIVESEIEELLGVRVLGIGN